MNNLEYLNQISQDNRVAKAPKNNTTKLLIKIGAGVVFALLFVLSLGFVLNSGRITPTDLTKQLYTRTANLDETLTEYNRFLKSSQLRAIGTSLDGALTSAAVSLSSYLSISNDSDTDLDLPEKLLDTETANIEELGTALNNAKLNGILDRIYANQIQLQVSLLIALISQLEQRTDDEELLDIIKQYQSNLDLIEQSLENYSSPSD